MNATAPPRPTRYFEDFAVGEVFEFGPIEVSRTEVVAFAERYDPQPMHVDKDAANTGPFGGLIASGWHTVGLQMRLLVDGFLSPEASLASPGIDELRWLRPVRPGDRLTVRLTIQEMRRSQSKPDRGLIRSVSETINQHGETVMTMRPMNLMRCRPTAA